MCIRDRNDHVCTRMEHVNNVLSISYGAAKYLGLNEELVMAIAVAVSYTHLDVYKRQVFEVSKRISFVSQSSASG